MEFAINNVQTVWLPFSQTYQISAFGSASWQEQVVFSDPNGLAPSTPFIGTGNPYGPTPIGSITTPSSYGELLAYPINVVITNDQGSGGLNWFPSYIGTNTLAPVVTYDQVNNEGILTNMSIQFQFA